MEDRLEHGELVGNCCQDILCRDSSVIELRESAKVPTLLVTVQAHLRRHQYLNSSQRNFTSLGKELAQKSTEV